MSEQKRTPGAGQDATGGDTNNVVPQSSHNEQGDASLILTAALEYASWGWHVFPITRETGRACQSEEYSGGRRWGATDDPAEIKRVWRKWPDANVGIACGESKLVVLDLDRKNGVDGVAWLEHMMLIEKMPDTLKASSPSGGLHYYFTAPDGIEVKNTAGKIAPGVDVRASGGMVLAPPSQKSGGAYSWESPLPLFTPADLPDWLLEEMLLASKPKGERKPTQEPHSDQDKLSPSWAKAALTGELATLRAAPEGRRNDALNMAAFRVGQVVHHLSDPEAARDELREEALRLGLEPGEVEATLESGFRAGQGSPRGPEGGDGGEDALDLSHDALALDLGRRSWDRDAKRVAQWGKWLFWDGQRWKPDELLSHVTRTRVFLRKRAEGLVKWAESKVEAGEVKDPDEFMKWAEREARSLRSKTTIMAVEALAQANPASVAMPDAFDADLMLIGTPGGVVDLRTGELRAATREDMITKQTAVAPAPRGTVPSRWLGFLGRIFGSDQELIAFMQRAAGYALTGQTVEHKLLFLHGTGRNGKSVFLNTLQGIWADYARKSPAETFLNTQGERHPTDIAGLRGARLVVGSELPRGRTWNESVIKDLTGGDVMTARLMRQDYFDFLPQLTLMIAGNTQPSFRGVDEAIRARVVLVPFNVTIPPEERDPALPDKLREEWPAILRWAIDGALIWQKTGLDVPAKVAAASDEYFAEEDIIGRYIEEEIVLAEGAFVSNTALTRDFNAWARG